MATHFWSGHWHGRQPAGDTHRRSREVITSSGGIFRCKFPSRKNGRTIHCEGLLELDAAYLFEANPRIARYREQPTQITYPDGARVRRYTPDFEVTLNTGAVIWVEIKPVSSLQHEDVQHKLAMVATHLSRSKQPFVVLTDAPLRLEPRQANARLICQRAGWVPPSLDAARSALRLCAEELPAPLHRVSTALAVRGVGVFNLLMLGLLRCDLSLPLTAETLIHLTEEDQDGWLCLSEEHDF